ncbi:homeobox KN domain-containing protein [Talaromyces proteolyticus]|uniref:Homeobox KN domain-containing protein n=1 Tax=Talaromyces proteolyticus TaxID=1131652 RepID=A0AAD4Q0I7_9EURO|nr:homeobox KN domain-containing protein [Talaromyces proteolyticus]KAH8704148.1 homeobox KN domain-containing protein [Talaromyces proteolyticus]
MAVTYSSNLPPSRNQTLPSFRELLPPHLHEEIERSSDASFKTSSARSSGHRGQPLPLPSGEMRQMHPSGTSTPTPAFSSRGPSPILPPLRDLQSASGRHLDRPMSAYDNAPRSGRPGQEAAYGARVSMEDDRFRSAPYGGGSGTTPAMYSQTAYDGARHGHYPASYSSESEYSPMTHNHTLPASTFGVIGDSLDSRGKRRRGNLPKPVTDILRAWFHEHLDHPYPTEEDKQIFMSRTGLSISQISNWFINARRRQLPALRNQIRNSDDQHRGGSPMSDADVGMSSPGSTASPTHPRHG